MRLIPIILGLVLLIAPASAILTNNTANTAYYTNNVSLISGSFLHDTNYIPKDYVILMILFGIIFWILAISGPICQDLFSIITPILFGVSAWYSMYMTTEQISIVSSGSAIYPVHTQIITPEPALQIILIIMTILSILSAIYVIFLAAVDSRLQSKREDTSQL